VSSASGGAATSAGGAALPDPAVQNALVDQSTDPYACAYISYDTAVGNPTSPTGDPINAYLTDAEGMGYASVCKRTGGTCWLTGPLQWQAEQLPRDGFLYNPATGLMEGGQYSVCEYNCSVDDCPQPTTGTARAQCGFPEVPENRVCLIACGNGETCPDGFLCIQPAIQIGDFLVPRQCVEYKYQSVTRQNVPP